jgi:bacteriocin-like protein
MELTMTTTSKHVRELTNQANELTVDELEHVSGGKPQDGRPVKYMEFQLKEVFITSVH